MSVKMLGAVALLALSVAAGRASSAEETAAVGQQEEPATVAAAGAGTAAAMPEAEARALLGRLTSAVQPAEHIAAFKELAQRKPKPLPAQVSTELLRSALLDEDAEVRREAALTIKALDDREGKKNLLAAALRPKVTEEVRTRAAEAIRRVDDPVVVGALITLVTNEIKSGVARLITPVEIQYIGGLVSLPIHLPEIELIKAEGTITYPAFIALKTIAQRDLGSDPNAWANWYANWKHLRDVRLRQEAGR
jgi:hypothetical protein